MGKNIEFNLWQRKSKEQKASENTLPKNKDFEPFEEGEGVFSTFWVQMCNFVVLICIRTIK